MMYELLKNHIGHEVVCVAYGDIDNPDDICIECEDCNEVLISSETEIAAKKAELRQSAEEKVKVYNDAIQSGDFETAYKTNEEIVEIVNEYTSVAREECFDECKSAENPKASIVKTNL